MSERASNHEEKTGPDTRYFSEAVRWENDVIRSVKRSRSIAWFVASIGSLLAVTAMACLALLLPLKSFEPYVIEVDKTTGFMEIKRPLAEGDLTQSEAVTRMNVVRYIRARETYDPSAVQDNFDMAQMLSTGDAARDLLNLDGPSSPTNPVNRFGRTQQTSFVRKVFPGFCVSCAIGTAPCDGNKSEGSSRQKCGG